MTSDREQVLAASVDGYMAKPLSLKELVSAIAKYQLICTIGRSLFAFTLAIATVRTIAVLLKALHTLFSAYDKSNLYL